MSGSHQVRSPGRVTWANLQKGLCSCHSYSSEHNVFKFSELNKATSTYNLYISDFWYIYDLGSGQIPDLSIISQWERCLVRAQRISKAQLLSESCALRPCMMTQGQLLISDSAKVVWSHPRSPAVFCRCPWGWEELETWKRSQCVCLVNTLRLICNLGHAVALTWGQILNLTLQGYTIHVSKRLDEASTMVSKLLLYHFKHRSYYWKTVLPKNAVFDISWPLTLKRLILGEIWRPRSEGAFQELSFAFLYLA